ncbi:MAG: type II toxin-antitoxin system VapB family antitoxin [Actinobacteria bacterium]|nr:type II toxin-antitoxin system VapB family antitoxin [Actinomycetota bacterium]MSW10926.1 type II toxin-antitoxin system VapB family antitoxin [Actinomycetota bacterium]MSX13014.1 type II toxin-antitoxin system VapB family antitoxin [Actinomycetota bacterium]MSY17027.1 type II toxin-antitoxin system VapB family antitoxin [Actinomycetota bacterium]MSY41150.1 type II toxin-antitoxin system VapB family antitoxin [Actinomycetota bacterium]
MSRTNIEIDDELIASCMERFGLPTKKSAVEFALRRLLGTADLLGRMRVVRGIGWEGDLEQMRSSSDLVDR